MIRADGFNGIAAIIWAADTRTTRGKSNDGRRFADTLDKSQKTVGAVMCIVDQNSGKRFSIGRTTAGNSEAQTFFENVPPKICLLYCSA